MVGMNEAPKEAPVENIVVGVDGSEASRAALQWAVDEAVIRAARVKAVHVWDWPTIGTTRLARLITDPDEIESEARRELDMLVDAADTERLDTPVERVLRCGRPAEWLFDEAKGADMLVVGERGLGGIILGSVGDQVTKHPRCPVVVVPADNA
jgi:nucleotide-binding universal stress UspA family protein